MASKGIGHWSPVLPTWAANKALEVDSTVTRCKYIKILNGFLPFWKYFVSFPTLSNRENLPHKMPIIIGYHILDALCYWQAISPVARVQAKLMKPRGKLPLMKWFSIMLVCFSKSTLFNQNKSTGSELENISDILLRQVITSWNQWQVDWQDLTRIIGPWNRNCSLVNSWCTCLICAPTYCHCWLSVAIGELKKLKVNISWIVSAGKVGVCLWCVCVCACVCLCVLVFVRVSVKLTISPFWIRKVRAVDWRQDLEFSIKCWSIKWQFGDAIADRLECQGWTR